MMGFKKTALNKTLSFLLVLAVALSLATVSPPARAAAAAASVHVDVSQNGSILKGADGVRLEFRENGADGTALSHTETPSANGATIKCLVSLPAEETTVYYKLWIRRSGGEIFAGGGWLDAEPGGYAFSLKPFVLTSPAAQTNIHPEDFSVAFVRDMKDRLLQPAEQKADSGCTLYTLVQEAVYYYETSSNVPGKEGDVGHFQAASGSIVIKLDGVLTVLRTVRFNLPEGASIQVWHSKRLYGYTYSQMPVEVDGSTYVFELKDVGASHYLVTQPGRISRDDRILAETIQAADPELGLTIDVPPLEPISDTRVDYAAAYSGTYFKHFEDGILMNAPDSQQIHLDGIGDTFLLKTFRASQLVYDATSAGAPEPEFHFEVIAGNSVTLDDTVSRNRCLLTAAVEGVSLIRVTYDALQINEAEHYHNAVFNGIDPRQVGLIVVSVGGEAFSTGITLQEYDTVYISDGLYLPGKTEPEVGTRTGTATYTFTLPESVRDAEVKVLHAPGNPLTGDWGFDQEANWNTCANVNGTVTIILEEGRNIIRVTHNGQTEYHVARALKTEIYIENLTNDGAEPALGDAVRVRFSDLNMPLPKLAKIYNPGYNYDNFFLDGKPTVRIAYHMNGETVMSQGAQYDLHTASYMDLYPDDIGMLAFSGGGNSSDLHGLWGPGGAQDHPRHRLPRRPARYGGRTGHLLLQLPAGFLL